MESGSYWLDKVRTSIWRDVRILAIEESYTTKYSIHPGADTMLCGYRLTNRWLSMKKDIASCGSKNLAYSEVEVKYQGSSGLTSMVDFRGNWNTHFREDEFLPKVTILWAITGESELNGSNLVQETTNKTVVMEGRRSHLGEFEISSWRGARVGVRTYLLGGAIHGSEANAIIRDPKLELESSRFTFDLVPLSYESIDVVVGENWLLRHKAEMVCHEKVVKMPWSCKVRVGSNGNLWWEASVLLGRKKDKTVFRMRNGHVEVYGYAFWVNQFTSGFHGVNEPGGVRVTREDDRRVTEGREDIREVSQQRGSGAKRKLSRCGRNQMGNELILALPEGADDFVVYYDARSKDLEACLEKKGEGDCLYVVTTEGSYERIAMLTWWGFSFEYGCASFEAWYGKIVALSFMAVTGESELNGSNLVQETTNKIVVIQERLEAAKLS
ncbi:hypothetical protein Tco_0454218 [Tanacetum coccineum]